jgi:oligopeptide/dipeptide ABC transporter ATP-binding protein
VAVAYAGEILEYGPASDVLSHPASPYTIGLIQCADSAPGEISFIPGKIPEPGSIGHQCPFAARCQLVSERCLNEPPVLREIRPRHWVACHNV